MIWLRKFSQFGRLVSGKNTFVMKNIGVMIICMIFMNDCICLMCIVTIMLNVVIVNVSSSCSAKILMISSGL